MTMTDGLLLIILIMLMAGFWFMEMYFKEIIELLKGQHNKKENN